MRNVAGKYVCLFFTLLIQACGQAQNPMVLTEAITQEVPLPPIIHPKGAQIADRIHPPAGFERVAVDDSAFAAYLRLLPLKPHGSVVKLYDGTTKPNHGVYVAVVDLPIGKRDLHQCADAVIRLRAEYLWKRKNYEAIHFNFTNGFRADYATWAQGNRIVVKGNDAQWAPRTAASTAYADFWKYLEMVFSYAGTLSLAQELVPVPIDSLAIGDVFIQGGSPGHAVLIVDMAQHRQSGQKVFLLAQSYMPAQEIQILENPNGHYGPWYPVATSGAEKLITPEWQFRFADLKRFSR